MHRLRVHYLPNYNPEWPRLTHNAHQLCFDLRAAIPEPVTLLPRLTFKETLEGEISVARPRPSKIPLGVKFDFSPEQGLEIHPRSLLSNNDIIIVNSEPQIDCDFRGEPQAVLLNLSPKPFTINPGDRIVQARVVERAHTIFHEIQEHELSQTARGEGGFGSTGRF